MPASTSQRRTKPKVRRNSDVIAKINVVHESDTTLKKCYQLRDNHAVDNFTEMAAR